MKLLAFDGRMGAAGDMLIAALLDAGADRAALRVVEESDVLPIRYDVDRTLTQGIEATTVTVRREGSEEPVESASAGGHSHGHSHEGDDPHGDSGGSHAVHRSYEEVLSLLDRLDLAAAVTADARSIFRILGKAESAVHGTALAETQFHEVGADDAIADVVGVALLSADLAPERVLTTPLSTGGGELDMSHGRYAVPAPAVVNIAAEASWEIRGGPIDAELLTPTGAAILAHYAEGVQRLPPLDVRQAGYGAGTQEFADRPNVLRAIVADRQGQLGREEIRLLETNLDDATPETLGALQETLGEAGARDVSIVPLTMKKSRPGHLVRVVVRPSDADRVARRLATETGTLGIRETGAGHRWVADRRFEQVSITIAEERFELTLKIASDGQGSVYDVSAEHDDVVAVAEATGMAVREVRRRAEAVYERSGR